MTVSSPDVDARHLELWAADMQRAADERGIGLGQLMRQLHEAQQIAEANDTPRPIPPFAVGFAAQWAKPNKALIGETIETKHSRAIGTRDNRRAAWERVKERLIDEELARGLFNPSP